MTQSTPPFCAPAGVVAPLYLKWMLVFEEPAQHTLWLGKATPRPWLTQGGKIAVANASTAYGRVSFSYIAAGKQLAAAEGSAAAVVPDAVHVQVGWARRAADPLPAGGLRIRLRLPSSGSTGGSGSGSGGRIVGATLRDGTLWTGIDDAAEALVFTAAELGAAGLIESLSSIRVVTAKK